MIRSRVLVVFLAALFFALTARSAPTQLPARVDAFGTLDYARGRALIKVGSWVKYHMTARTEMGVTEDYTSTVLIGGEDDSWGEECFWVETTVQGAEGAPRAMATLMSYAIFDDSLPAVNFKRYQRRRVMEFKDGQPVPQVLRRNNAELKSRAAPTPGLTTLVDTLGTDTLKTDLGDFVCLKVRTERGFGSTSQNADSSQYNETRIVRVTYLTPQIPVMGHAREEIDWTMTRRTWLTGRSQESSPLMVMDRSKGVLELVGFGTEGLEAQAVPVENRRSLAEQRAGPAPKPKTPAKPSPPER
jgi:hypothetical protein